MVRDTRSYREHEHDIGTINAVTKLLVLAGQELSDAATHLASYTSHKTAHQRAICLTHPIAEMEGVLRDAELTLKPLVAREINDEAPPD